MTLNELTHKAATRFLTTVLLVDESMAIGAEPLPGPLKAPGLGVGGGDKSASEGARPIETPPTSAVEISLDARSLVEAFSRQNLFATTVRPNESPVNEFVDDLEGLATRADITVLDWNLYNDNGARALALAKRITEADIGDRFRIIVIYTGQEPDQVQHVLEEGLELPTFENGRSGTKSLHVHVMVKADSTVVAANDPRRVEPHDLPDRLISSFATDLLGLLPTAALIGLAAIRENSFRLLGRFSRDLDAAFLGHRSLKVTPEEAADDLPDLLADELRAIVEAASFGEVASLEVINEWLTERSSTYTKYPAEYELPSDLPTGLDCMKAIHELGYPSTSNRRWKGKQQPKKLNAPLKRNPAGVHQLEVPEFVNERWAHVMTLRTDYLYRPPTLRLGAILAEEAESGAQYLFCMKPHCDSVRLYQPTPFAFLPMTVTTDQPLRFVVERDGSWVRLNVEIGLEGIETVTFTPDEGVIRAMMEEGSRPVFLGDDRRFEWLGEIRHDIAHALAQELAGKASRIGLSTNEWLRMNGRRGAG